MRQNLIKARREKGLTQRELGEMVGLSPAAIGHLEYSRNDARRSTWSKLAKVFRSTIEHLSRDDTASQ